MSDRRAVPDDTPLPASTEDLLRTLAPQVLGTLVRRFGDFDTAEDVLQEAMLAAATQWPHEGLPDNPRAWLIQVAQRRMADVVRAEVARRRRETTAFAREVADIAARDQDDSLAMLFLCCHPALSQASAIALTLRAVGGLTTEQIARAFLLPEATMAQRITRAKKKLAAVDRPFVQPGDAQWHARLGAVLHVLYLIFSEGHTAGSGSSLHRTDLSGEAIRLTRAVHRLLPGDAEVTSLLALMLLTDARRAARTSAHGELIPLAEQNRALWDRELIIEGTTLTTGTLTGGLRGPYQIQAIIAVLHAQAGCAEDTDWTTILAMYTRLEQLSDNPMVTLSRAVASAMVSGPSAGLVVAATLDERLAGNHRLDAVLGHLHEMAGDFAAAVTCYTAAAARTTSWPERDYLTVRAAGLRRHGHDRGTAADRPGRGQTTRVAAKHSAGVLLFRRTSGREVEVLIGHMGGPFWARKDLSAWSIPKGEYEPDSEDARAAAGREFTEELGLPVPDGDWIPLGGVRYGSGTKSKCLTVWAVEGDLDPADVVPGTFELEWPPRSGTIAEFPEIDRAAWFDTTTAREKLSAGQRPYLDRLTAHLTD
ncbi:DUF6596 domain-containing protein [Nocardia sp. NPDC049220]|uniref:DUF6596 domain-containing protein n=1 Tax=Nocardia sp. NPDC049220 TaxID=3155273 RepID=UPI0033C65CD6